jgi:hypothetical protein
VEAVAVAEVAAEAAAAAAARVRPGEAPALAAALGPAPAPAPAAARGPVVAPAWVAAIVRRRLVRRVVATVPHNVPAVDQASATVLGAQRGEEFVQVTAAGLPSGLCRLPVPISVAVPTLVRGLEEAATWAFPICRQLVWALQRGPASRTA